MRAWKEVNYGVYRWETFSNVKISDFFGKFEGKAWKLVEFVADFSRVKSEKCENCWGKGRKRDTIFISRLLSQTWRVWREKKCHAIGLFLPRLWKVVVASRVESQKFAENKNYLRKWRLLFRNFGKLIFKTRS